MRAHPACELFPLLDGTEFSDLVADIREHGQREPILLDGKGLILDGRNRERACRELGISPKTKLWHPRAGDSVLALVISLNIRRRHLDATQKALLADKLEPMLGKEAAERQRAAGAAGGQGGRGHKKTLTQKVEQGFADRNAGMAAAQAAAMTGANRQYVADVKALRKDDPDLYAELESGKVKLSEAKRKRKEKRREEKRAANRKLVESAPVSIEALADGSYSTIVLDPPWDWGDEGDKDQLGRARPVYSTMPIDEIAALPVGEFGTPNCHIYLWITNRSLPKGFALLEKWGFRYITLLTWCKPSFGMGNYFRGSTEHVLFGVRGSLPLLTQDQGTHFIAARGKGGHSSKPDEFYKLVERCSPGPWLEMFARSQRKGWRVFGAESAA